MTLLANTETVFIVDDDEAVRLSLSVLLEAEGIRTQAFAAASPFLRAVRSGDRGCVLLDIRLPDMTGLEVLGALAAINPVLPTVIITAFADVPLAVAAMKAGAVDFLEKPYSADALLSAVRRALDVAGRRGESDPQVADVSVRVASLTPREREVLELIAEGRQNKQIAFDLGISPRTVEIHRARVMEKMAATSLSHLLRMLIASRSPSRPHS
jgi:two-component system response regulator FixJ